MALSPCFRTILSLTLVAFALAGCSSQSSDGADDGAPEKGVTLLLADAPVDEAEVLEITISNVQFNSRTQGIRNIAFNTPPTVDLLKLQDGSTETLITNADLPTGEYDWLRLVLDTDQPPRLEINGEEHILPVPEQRFLEVGEDFSVPVDGDITFTLDFDVRKSLREDGQGGYVLRPQLRLIETEQGGELFGGVDVPTLQGRDGDCSNSSLPGAVYIYQGRDVTTFGELGSSSEPISVAAVKAVGDDSPDVGNLGHVYTAFHLPAGDYTLVYTCDADVPGTVGSNPDFSDPVSATVEAGSASRADLDGS